MSRARWLEWLKSDFGRLIMLAIGVRLLLIPLSHTWDGQSWANVFAELGQSGNPLEAVRRPYESMRELSLLTAAAGRHADHYEYWAYPPLQLYVFWPLARLYTLLAGPADARFAVQPTMIAPSLPIPLLALIHTPNIIGDVASLYIMRALGVSLSRLRWYAFNPFVLLVGAWTFDSEMVVFLLLALYWTERGNAVRSAAALGLGATMKFVALIALPAVLLTAAWNGGSVKSIAVRAVTSISVCAVVIAIACAPAIDGVVYVVQFQLSRFAAGMSLPQVWTSIVAPVPNSSYDWQPPVQAYVSGEIGGIILPVLVAGACLVLVIWHLPPSSGFLLLVLAFLAGAKVVNEPYALSAVALATIEIERRPSAGFRAGYLLLWLVPFAYAVLNTPVWAFFLSFVQQVEPGLTLAINGWLQVYREFRGLPEARWPYVGLTLLFEMGLVVLASSMVRVVRRQAHG